VRVGCGTIFGITPTGTLTTVYSFCSLADCADGAGPVGLIQDSNGDLYGTRNAEYESRFLVEVAFALPAEVLCRGSKEKLSK
jgi:hypothetical protein